MKMAAHGAVHWRALEKQQNRKVERCRKSVFSVPIASRN